MCILIPDFHVQLLDPGCQRAGSASRWGPIPADAMSPILGCEALPRMMPSGASSQAPRHWVTGTWSLRGGDRPQGNNPHECECTGVRHKNSASTWIQDSLATRTIMYFHFMLFIFLFLSLSLCQISESNEGHFQKDRLRTS